MTWLRRALLTLLLGAAIRPAQADGLSLNPEAWHIRYSQGMPAQPSLADVGWSFDFPRGGPCEAKYECPGVHYVTTPYRKPISANAKLTHLFSHRDARRGEV